MKFTKMHGLGNDYIYVYSEEDRDWGKLSQKLSDRHFGIGADGIIVISPSDSADFNMRIFNADGSEAKMCGNGIRCVGKFVYEKRLTQKKCLTVDTLSGIKYLVLDINENRVQYASVNMGEPKVSEKKKFFACDREYSYLPVDMGNPHAVVFCENVSDVDAENIGRAFQKCDEFSDGVNVEFVSVKSRNELDMRVFERGSGITLACGTGACAAVSAATYCEKCDKNSEIKVNLDGGTLYISFHDDGNIIMKGPAETVFEGEVEI